MKEIKFELVGRNKKFNEIKRHVVNLQDLIANAYTRYNNMPTFFDPLNDNLDFIAARRFTGLKDKNGRGIYEGDIAVYPDGSGGEIVFDRGTFCFAKDKGSSAPFGLAPHAKNIEVIGNIYENPELLEVKS